MPDNVERYIERVADPSILTTEALQRGLDAERDWTIGQLDVLKERLRGIDTATEVLNERVTLTPTETQQSMVHLRELMGEQFRSVAVQFSERDTRAQRESQDILLAVNAAFAAQEKQLLAQAATLAEQFRSIQVQFSERDTRSEREARDNKLAVDAAFAAQEKQALAQQESNALAIAKSETATSETIKTNFELSKTTTDAQAKTLDELKLQVSRIESLKQGGKDQMAALYALAGFVAMVVGIAATYGIVHK